MSEFKIAFIKDEAFQVSVEESGTIMALFADKPMHPGHPRAGSAKDFKGPSFPHWTKDTRQAKCSMAAIVTRLFPTHYAGIRPDEAIVEALREQLSIIATLGENWVPGYETPEGEFVSGYLERSNIAILRGPLIHSQGHLHHGLLYYCHVPMGLDYHHIGSGDEKVEWLSLEEAICLDKIKELEGEAQ